MTYTGLDFRGSASLVADPAGYTYALASDVYGTSGVSRGGVTFGHTGSSAFQEDVSSSLDPRIAGSLTLNTYNLQFRIDLANGAYVFELGAGHHAFALPNSVYVWDGAFKDDVNNVALDTNNLIDYPGASVAVATGKYVLHLGKLYRASTGGTTGGTQPSGTGNTTDGSVTWTYIRSALVFIAASQSNTGDILDAAGNDLSTSAWGSGQAASAMATVTQGYVTVTRGETSAWLRSIAFQAAWADLPANIPAAPPALTSQTATITTQAQLDAVLASSSSNGVHYVAAGSYTIALGSTYFTQQLILRAADPSDPPTLINTGSFNPAFTCTDGSGAGNIWLDKWKLRSGAPAYPSNAIVIVYGARDLRFSRCEVQGSLDTSGAYTGGATTRYGNGGFKFAGCSRVAVDRSSFSNISTGIIFIADGATRTSDCYSGYNDFSSLAKDAHNIVGTNRLCIEWCRFTDFQAAAGEHCDAMQAWVFPQASGEDHSSSNLTIRHNFAYSTAAATYPDNSPLFIQFVFLADSTSNSGQYSNVLIQSNECYAPGNWGILISGGQHVSIDGNMIVPSNRTAYTSVPVHAHIYADGCDDLSITNNTAEDFVTATYGLEPWDAGTSNTSVAHSGNTSGATGVSDSYMQSQETAWVSARVTAGY